MKCIPVVLGLVLAPVLFGIINRTKAVFAGRKGQPLLQAYFDILKGLRRGAVYSRTTTPLFYLGPVTGLAVMLLGLFFVPFFGTGALLAFQGDFILLIYLLGLARFITVLAALDTGSSFEGMGASREVLFSALAEPALLTGFAALARHSETLSLSQMLPHVSIIQPAAILVGAAWLIVLLCENARIPFDDPNTHLELTMIHELMVLDHSGPDLALIQYASALKFWILSVLVVTLILPDPSGITAEMRLLYGLGAMALLGIAVGIIESVMARLRLTRVPQLLTAAGALSALAFLLVLG